MAEKTLTGKFVADGGAKIRCCHAMDSYLYLGTGPDGFVYRTRDGLALEEFYKTGDSYVTAITDFWGGLFVGTSPGGKILMHNFETGNRFHYVTTGDYKVTAFAVYNDVLYAGTSPSGLILSFDGYTWNMGYDAYGSSITRLVTFGENMYVFLEGVAFVPYLSSQGWGLLKSGEEFFAVSGMKKVTTSISILQQNENHDFSFACAAVVSGKMYFSCPGSCNLYAYDGTSVEMVYQWDGTEIKDIVNIENEQIAVAVDDMTYVAEIT